jgi:transcription elongation factor Elf1
MPKERPSIRTLDNCSFCGDHKDEVPLMISNTEVTAAICSTCALSVVDQTYQWAGKIFKSMKADMVRQKAAEKRIITGDKVDDAIRKAQQ